MRSIVWAASFECRVANTRWPVSAAVSAAETVFVIPHFSDENHVGVLAKDVLECRWKTVGVRANFSLFDSGLPAWMDVFDRVF